MPRYAIPIEENYLDLIAFLNDGHRPEIGNEFTYLVFEILSPRDIKSKIVTEEEVFFENGRAIDATLITVT